MVRMKVLNTCKLDTYQILNFMFKIKPYQARCIFEKEFMKNQHQYWTRFSKNNFVETQLVSNQTKFSVSSQGLILWNKLSDQQQKPLERETCFKKSIKLSLFSLDNVARSF